MSSVATEPPPPPPRPSLRRRTGLFIAGFVVLQFLVPLSYLMRDDPTDERFTWRPADRAEALSCEITARMAMTDGVSTTLAPEKLLHQDWVEHLRRDRNAVITAFLYKQCETEGALEVTLTNACDGAEEVREYRLRCGSNEAQVSPRTASR